MHLCYVLLILLAFQRKNYLVSASEELIFNNKY
jgi:hypothetical protein